MKKLDLSRLEKNWDANTRRVSRIADDNTVKTVADVKKVERATPRFNTKTKEVSWGYPVRKKVLDKSNVR